MLPSKGPIQPHLAHLPRRRVRTQDHDSPPHTSTTHPSHPNSTAPQRPQQPSPILQQVRFTPETPSTSTRSTLYDSSDRNPDDDIIPIAGKPITPLTSPSDDHHHAQSSSAGADGLLPPAKFSSSFPLRHSTPDGAEYSTPPPELRRLHIGSRARGHSEPHVTNLPRRKGARSTKKDKEKERVRERCLQEVFKGSGIWIAFGEREEGSAVKCSSLEEEEEERDWMWDDKFGFTAVIRVWVNEHTRPKQKDDDARKDGLDLIIEQHEADALDDSGVSALTPAQFEDVAQFLAKHQSSRKVLIVVPRSRPVEALSLALVALSRPSSSSSSSSYLSRVRFLPGILDLVPDHQDAPINDVSPHIETDLATARSSLLQRALWHLHDLTAFGESGGVHDELKLEWRGSVSVDGMKKLEAL